MCSLLASHPYPVERLVRVATGAADDDPDGLIDDRPVDQGSLQGIRRSLGLREDLRVLHGHQ